MHLDGDLARAAAHSAADVRRRFFDEDGRLTTLPAKLSRRLAALDVVVQRFVPGVYYTESEVNRELMGIFDDYVRLRRELVDARLLDRADGRYWRCGGTVARDPDDEWSRGDRGGRDLGDQGRRDGVDPGGRDLGDQGRRDGVGPDSSQPDGGRGGDPADG
jgi:hypothetical protein